VRPIVHPLRVAGVAVLVPVLMRLRLRTVARVLALARPRQARTIDPAVLAHTVSQAQRFGRPLVRGGCQTRAITLYWFLRRGGYPVELCFGVEPLHAGASGHCWLELGGEPFLERVDPRPQFLEMYRIPPR
jgi:hypothetical protein